MSAPLNTVAYIQIIDNGPPTRYGHTRWRIVVDDCPYCGKAHYHGGGDGETPLLGHRVADCFRGDYYLETAPHLTNSQPALNRPKQG